MPDFWMFMDYQEDYLKTGVMMVAVNGLAGAGGRKSAARVSHGLCWPRLGSVEKTYIRRVVLLILFC